MPRFWRLLVPSALCLAILGGISAAPALGVAPIRLVVNGVEAHPDVPPQIVNDRVVVPLRFIAEAFGFEVGWNPVTRTVTVEGRPAPAPGELEVHFIDVGQADSILVELPTGEAFLVDAGRDSNAETVLGYLASEAVARLDFVVGTHPHADHVGGLDEIIRALPVELVILSPTAAGEAAYADVLAAARERGVLTAWAQAPAVVVRDDDVTVSVLGPCDAVYEDTNDYSVVLKVSYGTIDFLLTGDAESAAEEDLLEAGRDLEAEVIKVGHHGSRSSSGAAFLAAVDPEYAVISVGLQNPYGHPGAQTLEALAAAGAAVFRTDLQGTIVATATKSTVSFNVGPWSEAGGGPTGAGSGTPAATEVRIRATSSEPEPPS